MSGDSGEALRRLLSIDAFEARLVARRSGHYVVLQRRSETGVVRIELGTDADGAGLSVDDAMRARLGDRGFARLAGDTRPRPWASVLREPTVELLQSRLDDALVALGAPEGSIQLELTVDAEQPPENPKLIEAMRDVARSSAVTKRQALYAALVNSTLLVPIDPETADLELDEQRPLVLDSFDGGPVYAAFSDVASLRSWRHAGHPWAAVHGAIFFAHAERESAGAIRINPDGAIGGELYRNEVEAITEGVRRFHASRMN